MGDSTTEGIKDYGTVIAPSGAQRSSPVAQVASCPLAPADRLKKPSAWVTQFSSSIRSRWHQSDKPRIGCHSCSRLYSEKKNQMFSLLDWARLPIGLRKLWKLFQLDKTHCQPPFFSTKQMGRSAESFYIRTKESGRGGKGRERLQTQRSDSNQAIGAIRFPKNTLFG